MWAAILLGQVAFAAVLWIVHPQDKMPHQAQLLTPLLAVAAAALVLGVAAAVVLRARRVEDLPEPRLGQWLLVRMVVPMALLEGGSLVGLIGVMLVGSWWPMGLAPAISVAVQLLLFPQ